MGKRLFDEEGNEVKGVKVKKPFYKRWWFIALAVILVIGAVTSDNDDTSGEAINEDIEVVEKQRGKESDTEESKEEPQVEEAVEPEPEVVEEEEPEPEPEVEEVPREHKNALRAAGNYISLMAFSESGLYEQLTSEYGDGYPAEAAQYAIDNIEVDYNEQALKSAENYLDIMPMSDAELLNQLTSEYGDGFTQEQAQYAIDNLD